MVVRVIEPLKSCGPSLRKMNTNTHTKGFIHHFRISTNPLKLIRGPTLRILCLIHVKKEDFEIQRGEKTYQKKQNVLEGEIYLGSRDICSVLFFPMPYVAKTVLLVRS